MNRVLFGATHQITLISHPTIGAHSQVREDLKYQLGTIIDQYDGLYSEPQQGRTHADKHGNTFFYSETIETGPPVIKAELQGVTSDPKTGEKQVNATLKVEANAADIALADLSARFKARCSGMTFIHNFVPEQPTQAAFKAAIEALKRQAQS
jgi:hypothetical protein